MAGQFMLEAVNNGFDVNKGVLGGWKNFQKKGIQNYRQSSSYFLYDLVQAYRLYTLAIASEPDNGAMNRLRENKDLSPQARWMLSSVYSICGKKNISREIIKGIRREFKPYPSSNISFGSPVRDEAIAMEALVLADKMPEAMNLARNLAKSFSMNPRTSQEVAFASIALGRLSQKVNTGLMDVMISQNGKEETVKGPKTAYSFNANSSLGEISVRNRSEGPIYASLLTVNRVSFDKKVPASAHGLRIEARYCGPDGSNIDPSSIRQGTDITAKVTVFNTGGYEDYSNLALTWTIPSGWEICNERLSGNSGDTDNSYNYNDIRDDKSIYYFYLPKHTSKTFTLRLRAAYQGVFVLPSIKCEAMYEPGIYACTASGHSAVIK